MAVRLGQRGFPPSAGSRPEFAAPGRHRGADGAIRIPRAGDVAEAAKALNFPSLIGVLVVLVPGGIVPATQRAPWGIGRLWH